MSKSRSKIFANLQGRQSPFDDSKIPDDFLPVVPVDDQKPAALKARFVTEAEKLAVVVHLAPDDSHATQAIVELLKGVDRISAWDYDNIPLVGLQTSLEDAEIEIALHDDPHVEFGLTGVRAALASTGSIILDSGQGKYRAPSILPPTHIAVLKETLIFATFESWIAHQRELGIENFSGPSNIVLVSGASRTADIAMELVVGMHGPKELHIVIVP